MYLAVSGTECREEDRQPRLLHLSRGPQHKSVLYSLTSWLVSSMMLTSQPRSSRGGRLILRTSILCYVEELRTFLVRASSVAGRIWRTSRVKIPVVPASSSRVKDGFEKGANT